MAETFETLHETLFAMIDRAVVFVLSPLDALRSAFLRLIGGLGRPFFASRDARVLAYASVSITLTFFACVLFPMWMLALGPLILGVPHLLSDVRYLVARPRLHTRGLRMLLVAAPLAATWIWPSLGMGALALVALVFVASGSLPRRLFIVASAFAAMLASYAYGYTADLVTAHVHNFVALGLWWSFAPRSRWHTSVLALVAVGCMLIALGAVDGLALKTHGLSDLGNVRFESFTSAFSLSADPRIAYRFALFFAFMQSVHYIVWLRLIPEDARERVGIRSFVSSYHALVADVGRPLLMLLGAVSIGLLLWALHDLEGARFGYLRGVFFHGYLEFAVIALAFLEGRRYVGKLRV